MIPQAAKLTSLDVYRDGGSISEFFEGKDEINYCLFFKINTVSHGTKQIESEGYKSPVLERYINDDYTSPVTGVTSPDWKKEIDPITWKEACLLIKEIQPYLEGFETDYYWVYDKMKNVAEHNGNDNQNS